MRAGSKLGDRVGLGAGAGVWLGTWEGVLVGREAAAGGVSPAGGAGWGEAGRPVRRQAEARNSITMDEIVFRSIPAPFSAMFFYLKHARPGKVMRINPFNTLLKYKGHHEHQGLDGFPFVNLVPFVFNRLD